MAEEEGIRNIVFDSVKAGFHGSCDMMAAIVISSGVGHVVSLLVRAVDDSNLDHTLRLTLGSGGKDFDDNSYGLM